MKPRIMGRVNMRFVIAPHSFSSIAATCGSMLRRVALEARGLGAAALTLRLKL
jgi:hypothetical protein